MRINDIGAWIKFKQNIPGGYLDLPDKNYEFSILYKLLDSFNNLYFLTGVFSSFWGLGIIIYLFTPNFYTLGFFIFYFILIGALIEAIDKDKFTVDKFFFLFILSLFSAFSWFVTFKF